VHHRDATNWGDRCFCLRILCAVGTCSRPTR